MMFDRVGFAIVFDLSGLTKAELASIYGVSRQTLYNWIDKDSGGPTQPLIVERAAAYTAALVAAIKSGVLPIRAVGAVRAERVLKMKRALHDLTKPKT